MKKTNKFLAILMVLLLLVQAVMPVYAFAEEPANEVLTLGETTELAYTAGGTVNKLYSFTPTESGRYNFETYHLLDGADVYVWNADMTMLLDCKYDFDYNVVGTDLEAGNEYIVNVVMYPGHDGTATVAVRKAPAVADFTITSLPYRTTYIVDDIEDGNSYLGYDGLQLNVMFDDETSMDVDYTYDSYVNGYYIDVQTDVDPESETYGVVTVTVGDKTETFEIDIIENPVAKIEYVGKPIEHFENTEGYIVDLEDDEYFRYFYSEIFDDDAIKVTFKDGTTKLVNLYEDVVEDYTIQEHEDQHNNHWTVGGNNVIILSFFDVKCEVKVKIVKSEVKKIEVKSNPKAEYVFGDYDAGSMYGGDYYLWPELLDGLVFDVTFNDGSKKTFYGEDVDLYNENIGDYYFSSVNSVVAEKAGTYNVPFNFAGMQSEYKITVKESPVKKLELVKNPTFMTIPEGFDSGNIGAEFKVTYKDGKTETIKVTKENVECSGAYCYVDTGDNILAIVQDYFEDVQESKYVAYYFGVSCDVPEVVYTEPLDIVDMQVKNAGDSDKMEFILEYADGTKETFKVDKVGMSGGFGGGDPDISYETFYTLTKYGLMAVDIGTVSDAGLPIARHVFAFGQEYVETLNENAKLSKIEISTKPNVVRYEKGEEFDPSGLIIKTFYDNGESGYIYYDYNEGKYDIEISKVDMSKEGTKTVKVKFGGKEASFTIEVGGSFKDVKKGSWYEEYVDYAARYGIFNGTGNNNFSPDAKLSRAQFVQVLANIDGVDLDNNIKSDFKDVESGKWYTGAVQWAADNNIVSGTGDGKFNPDADVSREQMCVILVNFVEKYWYSTLDKKVIATKFADDADISSWAKDSVYKSFRADLVSGTGNNKFSPKLSATRSQGATIFTKFHKDYIIY